MERRPIEQKTSLYDKLRKTEDSLKPKSWIQQIVGLNRTLTRQEKDAHDWQIIMLLEHVVTSFISRLVYIKEYLLEEVDSLNEYHPRIHLKKDWQRRVDLDL